jgi:hypothetical protein
MGLPPECALLNSRGRHENVAIKELLCALLMNAIQNQELANVDQ